MIIKAHSPEKRSANRSITEASVETENDSINKISPRKNLMHSRVKSVGGSTLDSRLSVISSRRTLKAIKQDKMSIKDLVNTYFKSGNPNNHYR